MTPCAAAQRIENQKFLAAHAPELPLGGCDTPQQCRCRYKYHADRRTDVRRDTDHGLPDGPFPGENRRYRKDRRKRTQARALAS